MDVIWDVRAKLDIEAWLAYMEKRNPIAGQKVVELVFDEIDRIAEMPLIGKAGMVFGTREKKVDGTPLKIIYGVLDNTVHILFVPHDRQKWPPESIDEE